MIHLNNANCRRNFDWALSNSNTGRRLLTMGFPKLLRQYERQNQWKMYGSGAIKSPQWRHTGLIKSFSCIESWALNMPKPLQCDKPSNDCYSWPEYWPKPHQTDSGVVKKSRPEELFSNWVEGKKLSQLDPHTDSCGKKWQFLLVATVEKTIPVNFYWLPLLKKLLLSMVEGFEEVKNIFAEKGLTHCPPITCSDLEDWTSGRSSSTSTTTSSGSSNGGKIIMPHKRRSGDGPGSKGFANPSDGGEQQSLHFLHEIIKNYSTVALHHLLHHL